MEKLRYSVVRNLQNKFNHKKIKHIFWTLFLVHLTLVLVSFDFVKRDKKEKK